VAATNDALLPSPSPLPTRTHPSVSLEAAEAGNDDENGADTLAMQQDAPTDQDSAGAGAALENEFRADGETTLEQAMPPAPASQVGVLTEALNLPTASPASTLLPSTPPADASSFAYQAQQAQSIIAPTAGPGLGNALPSTSASTALQATPSNEERLRDLTLVVPEEDQQDRFEASEPVAETGRFIRIEHSPVVGIGLLFGGGLLLILGIITTFLRRRRS
jgi:hypothetical protein